MSSLLTVEELSVRAGDRLLCERLRLEVRPGEFWAVLGPNGAGKTSLLHTLAGLRPAAGGSCRCGDLRIDQAKPREVARLMGVVLQELADSFPATVLETALIGRHPHLGPWQTESVQDEILARQALELFGLGALADRLSNTLSGGERQRLALATVFTQGAPLLLLDEPVSHQDLGQQIRVLEAVSGHVAAGGASLSVLHDVNIAARFCTHALLLYGDGAYLAGPFDGVVNAQSLQQLYGYPVTAISAEGSRYWIPCRTQS